MAKNLDPRRVARDLAVETAGGPAALGRELKISGAAVSQWDVVPIDRVVDVERITGISRHVLRPDICGPEPGKPVEKRRRRRQSRMEAAA